MPRPVAHDRKRRTREHILGDLSFHFVQGKVLREGHVLDKPEDYGYDAELTTFRPNGCAENGVAYFQFKGSDSLRSNRAGQHYPYPLDVRDYNRWKDEPAPVFFVLYDAKRDCAFWLYAQAYFRTHHVTVRRGAKTVTVHVPVINKLSRRTIRMFRGKIQKTVQQSTQVIVHE